MTSEGQNIAGSIAGVEALMRELIGKIDGFSSRLAITEEIVAGQEATRAGLEDAKAAQRRQRRTNRLLIGLAASNALLFVATTVLGVAVWNNARHIGEVQDRTSNAVLCPLYGLFVAQIAAAPPESADANRDGVVTAEEQDRWDQSVQVISDGYAALDCRQR